MKPNSNLSLFKNLLLISIALIIISCGDKKDTFPPKEFSSFNEIIELYTPIIKEENIRSKDRNVTNYESIVHLNNGPIARIVLNVGAEHEDKDGYRVYGEMYPVAEKSNGEYDSSHYYLSKMDFEILSGKEIKFENIKTDSFVLGEIFYDNSITHPSLGDSKNSLIKNERYVLNGNGYEYRLRNGSTDTIYKMNIKNGKPNGKKWESRTYNIKNERVQVLGDEGFFEEGKKVGIHIKRSNGITLSKSTYHSSGALEEVVYYDDISSDIKNLLEDETLHFLIQEDKNGNKYYTGPIKKIESFKNGKKNGEFLEYYITNEYPVLKQGKLKSKESYSDGYRNGLFQSFYLDGTLEEEGSWQNGNRIGKWTEYDRNGDVEKFQNFKKAN